MFNVSATGALNSTSHRIIDLDKAFDSLNKPRYLPVSGVTFQVFQMEEGSLSYGRNRCKRISVDYPAVFEDKL